MVETSVVHICKFSTSLGDLSPRKQTTKNVLAALKAEGRFSVFDATSTMKIARALDRLQKKKLFELSKLPFPWIKVRITPAGEEFLKSARPKGSET